MPFIMISGSVPLKVDTTYAQYFSEALKPYEHYVPVKADFSNLVE
jgi:hypothetical protein